MLIEELSQSVTLFGLGMGTVFVLLAMLIACVTMLSICCRYWAGDSFVEQPVIPAIKHEYSHEKSNQGGVVEAPLSANVIEVCVEKGAYVDEGDVVMRLEAMKMETEVRANCGGKVSEVHANAGDSVESGQTIVTLLEDSSVDQRLHSSKQLTADRASQDGNRDAPNTVNSRTINAPLSANVVDVCVELHRSVKEGDVVVKLEAMKMETEVIADCDGDVSEIHIKKGDSINAGQIILTLN